MATPALQFSSSALWSRLAALWDRVSRLSQRAPKTLRLCQSLPLGERRFVAVVEFEKARFLVGGTSSSLVLLSRLTDSGCEVEDERESDARQLAREKPAKNRGNERC
jgi:flagellar biogenesis protein FliO